MASSYVTYTGDGAQLTWAVTFPYLDKSHVHVYVAGVETTSFTWDSSTIIRISPAVANAASLKIARKTPDAPITTFSNSNILTADNLNTAELQTLYRAVEANDAVADSLTAATQAATYASNAATSASNAATSASNASTSAGAAAASAAAAATFNPALFLQKSDNLASVADAPTARSNLGLQALATKATIGTADIAAAAYANTAEAQAGTDAAKIMTAARTKDAIAALGAWQFISSQLVGSAVATVDFTNLPTGYDILKFLITGVYGSTDDVQMLMRFGTGATPTWQSSAGAYRWLIQGEYDNAVLAGQFSGAAGDTSMWLTGNSAGVKISNTSDRVWNSEIDVYNPSGSVRPSIQHRSQSIASNADNNYTLQHIGAGQYTTAGAITAARFLLSSGNIQAGARFVLVGLRRT